MQDSLKRQITSLPGHLFFFVYILLCILYTQERILITDTAHFLFEIINSGWYNIAHHRYTSGVVQTLPLVLSKAGLPLPIVATAFSLSFPLLFYACYVTSFHILKKPVAAYCMVFFISLTVGEAFFTPIADMNLFMACLSLYIGFSSWLSQQHRIRWYHLTLLSALLLCSLRSHPLSILFIPFAMLWPFLDGEKKPWRFLVLQLMLFLALYGLEKILIPSNGYDQHLIKNLLSSLESPSKLAESRVIGFLIARLKTRYLLAEILIGTSFIFSLIRKEYFRAGFLMLSTVGYLILIAGAYYKGDSPLMLDKNFMPLAIFASLPFFSYLFAHVSQHWIRMTLASVLIVISFVGMSGYTDYYKERISLLHRLSNAMPKRKMVLNQSVTPQPALRAVWALSPEIMIVSAWNGPEGCKTLYSVNNRTLKKTRLDIANSFWNTPFGPPMPQEKLNQAYFTLPAEPYSILQLQDLQPDQSL